MLPAIPVCLGAPISHLFFSVVGPVDKNVTGLFMFYRNRNSSRWVKGFKSAIGTLIFISCAGTYAMVSAFQLGKALQKTDRLINGPDHDLPSWAIALVIIFTGPVALNFANSSTNSF